MKKIFFSFLVGLVLVSVSWSLPKFKDVPDDSWASDAVYGLVKRGITNGFPDGTFRGSEKMTRYEIAVFLNRMAEVLENNQKTPQEAPWLSGQIFFRLSKALTNATTTNNFDIDRAYLTAAGPIGKNARGQITLDSARNTGKLDTFLKYAYADLDNVVQEKLISGITLTTRVGLQPTYWSPWVDKILGFRIVAKSLSDLDAGIPSSDFGLAIYGRAIPNEFLATNYFISVTNGNGYTQAETNAGKNIAARFDTQLTPYLTMAIGGQIEDASRSGNGDSTANALIACQFGIWRSYFEFLRGKTNQGYSLAGLIDLYDLESMLPYQLFARLDNYDPNKAAANDDLVRVIVGTSYLFNEQIKVIFDYNNTTYGIAAPSNAGQTTSAVSLRTQIDL